MSNFIDWAETQRISETSKANKEINKNNNLTNKDENEGGCCLTLFLFLKTRTHNNDLNILLYKFNKRLGHFESENDTVHIAQDFNNALFSLDVFQHHPAIEDPPLRPRKSHCRPLSRRYKVAQLFSGYCGNSVHSRSRNDEFLIQSSASSLLKYCITTILCSLNCEIKFKFHSDDDVLQGCGGHSRKSRLLGSTSFGVCVSYVDGHAQGPDCPQCANPSRKIAAFLVSIHDICGDAHQHYRDRQDCQCEHSKTEPVQKTISHCIPLPFLGAIVAQGPATSRTEAAQTELQQRLAALMNSTKMETANV